MLSSLDDALSSGLSATRCRGSCTYLISALFLSRIPLPRPERGASESFSTEFKAGLSYLAGARIPLAIVGGAFLLMLAASITVPAEIFLAKDAFGAGDAGYGFLVAMWGGGMVLGSAFIALLGVRVNLLAFYFAGILVSALALAGAGLAPAFAVALVAVAAGGIANGIDNVTTDTILQKGVSEELLGRVFSVRFLTLGVGEAIAYPVGGLLVDATDPRFTYVSIGAAIALSGLIIFLFLALSRPGPEKNSS
jgi:MFS family permease